MASGVLQMLYNAADMFVVGNFIGDGALASVGATTTLFSVITSLFMGLSVGMDVLCSKSYGYGDRRGVKEAIDTGISACLPIGIAVSAVTFFAVPWLLTLMGTPHDGGVFDGAVIYLRTVTLGIPFTMFYNFAAAVLRTSGDTKHPFIYITVAGAANFALNLFFVLVCDLGVLGVALGTILSQALSAVLIGIELCRRGGVFSFSPKDISFSFGKLGKILSVGFLAGVQSSLFSVGNAFLQTGVNTFGKIGIAGNTAAETVENLLWAACSSFQYACITFVGQNAGAGRFDRVRTSVLSSVAYAAGTAFFFGMLFYFTRYTVIGIFVSGSAETVAAGAERAAVTYPFYALCGMMAVLPAAIQGLGHSLSPTVVNVVFIFGLRVTWLYTAFAQNPTPGTLYMIHPITWLISDTVLTLLLIFAYRREKRKFTAARTA